MDLVYTLKKENQMKKIVVVLMGICLLLLFTTPSFSCDRYLTEYFGYLREIKDLHQFEAEATTRREANQMRRERLDVIWVARLAHGNYIKCIERRQAKYKRGTQKRQFRNEQRAAVEDTAINYGLDPNEAVGMVLDNILPSWMR
jgi:hypothetical protein